MSSILEALRKSERERTLLRGIGFGDAGRRLVPGTDWLPWVIAAGAVVIALGIVAAVLLLRSGATTSAPGVDSTPAPSAVTGAAATPATDAAPAVTPAAPDLPEHKTSLPPLVDVTVKSPAPVAALAPASGAVRLLTAMPPEFQQRLPALTVNIHVYSPEESQRILYINNRSYRRGDEISGGVVVEEIVADGVVLQFQGQRFKLPRPS